MPDTTNPKPLSQKTDAELKRETKARLRHLDPLTATELVNDVVSEQVKGSVSGFMSFLRENAVLSLAIGFVLGSQVQAVVNKFIQGFIDPMFQLLLPGNKTLSAQTYTLSLNGHTGSFQWGGLVYALLDFLFVAATIYAVIKIFQLDKLGKK